MKTATLVKLSAKNISTHKAGVLVSTLALSILFTVFSAFAYIIQGTENVIIDDSMSYTEGKIILSSNFCDGDYQNETKRCEDPKIYDSKADDLAKKYHGEKFGSVISYTNQNGDNVYVILDKAARFLKSEPAYYAPESKIPVIAKDGYKGDNSFYILGYYPKSNANIKDESFYVYQEFDSKPYYLVLDNTARVQDYLATNGYTVYSYAPVIEFDKFDDAYNYYKDNNCADAGTCKDLNVIEELFTHNIVNRISYNKAYASLVSYIIVLLLAEIVILTIVFIFTSKKDSRTILLYRTLGATEKDIYKLYLYELIEIAIFITVFMLGFGLLAAIIFKSFAGLNYLHILAILAVFISAFVSSVLIFPFITTKTALRRLNK